MAGNLNVAMVSGRLGRDPEIRNSGAGKPIGNFSLASSEYWTKDGEKKERTEWFNVVCFNEVTSRYIEHNVRKGDYVRVMGRIRTREWEKDGIKRYSTEIVIEQFFGEVEKVTAGGTGNRPPPSDNEDAYGKTSARPGKGGGAAPAPIDDDIPFAPEWR